MDEPTRKHLVEALGHLRSAQVADSVGAPVRPALRCAEICIMKTLFSEDDIEEYVKTCEKT
jgi:hypothetical protein